MVKVPIRYPISALIRVLTVVLRRRRAWEVRGGAGAVGVGSSSEAGGWTGGQRCERVCVLVCARVGSCM